MPLKYSHFYQQIFFIGKRNPEKFNSNVMTDYCCFFKKEILLSHNRKIKILQKKANLNAKH